MSAQPDISRQLTPSDPVEITDIVDDFEDILGQGGKKGMDRRAALESQASAKPKELIKAQNVMHVKSPEKESNSAKKMTEATSPITPKDKEQSENLNEKVPRTEQKPPVLPFASPANTSDKKEPKRAGWGSKGTAVLGEDSNRTNVAPNFSDARKPTLVDGGISAFAGN